MSRSNPAGFVLGIALEVGAVVLAVALVPRLDLGPPSKEATSDDVQSVPVDRTGQGQPTPAVTNNWRQPPRLIQVDPAQTQPIEQQLDAASQKLINSVGAYAVRATNDILQTQPVAAPPIAAPPAPSASPPPANTSQLSFARPAAVRPRNSAAPAGPPRPWMRY